MKRMLHIIQNDPEVPPGNIFAHLAIPYVIHHPYRGEKLPEPSQIPALIVLGGSMGATAGGGPWGSCGITPLGGSRQFGRVAD